MSKILVSGGLVPTTKDTLLDARTRVAAFSDIANIENPARFMVITVEDTGKKYEVKKLSSKIIGGIVVENSTIDINDPEALVDLGLAEELRSEEEKVRQSNEKKRIEAENLRKSAEDSRNVNETNRVSAEGVREASERTRVSSEETRNANEQTRNSNETKRQLQESTRQSQESARQNNERTRNTNESARKEAESERKTEETSRRTAELSRSSAENTRAKNEQNRTTAENTRSSAEDRRVANETQRTANETARSNAELSREQAEGNRASTFNTLKGQMQTTIQEGQTAVAATEKATSDAQKVVDNYDAKVAEQDSKLSELGSEVDDFKEAVTNQVNNYKPIEINGNVTNAADEEDLTSDENNLLKLKNRNNLNGMGYVVLRKNKTFAEQLTQTNTVYEIRYDFDMNGLTVTIPQGCVLKFVGGKISNGIIKGTDTEITNSGGEIFSNIQLIDAWRGSVVDLWFSYNLESKEHYNIIASMLKFNYVTFFRKKYYIEKWNTIFLSKGDSVIEGNDVVFVLTSNKGETDPGYANIPKYKIGSLFSKYYEAKEAPFNRGNYLQVNNLSILDNSSITGDSSWGEDVSSVVIYNIFEGTGEVLFDSVTYNGGGQLYKSYNWNCLVDRFCVQNCDISTNLFCIELFLLDLNKDGKDYYGKINNCIFKNNKFRNHETAVFVGPLSLVANTANACIEVFSFENNQVISEKGNANLETFGCKTLYIYNNLLDGCGLNSEAGKEEKAYIRNNRFIHNPIKDGVTYSPPAIYANEIIFEHNYVTLKYGHLVIRKANAVSYFECADNTFINDKLTNEYNAFLVLDTDNAVNYFIGNKYISTSGISTSYPPAIRLPKKMNVFEDSISPVLFDITGFKGFDKWIYPSTSDTFETQNNYLVQGQTVELDTSDAITDKSYTIEIDARLITGDGNLPLIEFGINGINFVLKQNYSNMTLYKGEVSTETYFSTTDYRISKGYGDNMIVKLCIDAYNQEYISISLYVNGINVLNYIDNEILSSEFVLDYARIIATKKLWIRAYRSYNGGIFPKVGFKARLPYVDYAIAKLNDKQISVGEKANRLSGSSVSKGECYFDTTINKPIWWTGSAWVDATGATV